MECCSETLAALPWILCHSVNDDIILRYRTCSNESGSQFLVQFIPISVIVLNKSTRLCKFLPTKVGSDKKIIISHSYTNHSAITCT